MQNKAEKQSFRVTDIQHLSHDVFRVYLECINGFISEYQAGQYLMIHLDTGESCAFSIASAPIFEQTSLELHIQKQPDRPNSIALFEQLEQGEITATVANGKCHLQQIPDKPLTFIAAGTGFAQMKSMIEHCQNAGHPHDLNLYWGARSPDDYYLSSLPVQWSAGGLHYHPVVSESVEDDEWNGRHGLLYEAIITDKELLVHSEIFISGSPNMVYATVDAIVKEGFDEKNIHSDVFEYAPRT